MTMNKEEKTAKMVDPLIYRRLWAFIAPHKKLVIFSVTLLLLAMAGELYVPVLIQQTVDQYIMADIPGAEAVRGLNINIGTLLLILVGIVTFSFGQIYILASLSQEVMAQMRRKTFSHILRQKMDFLNTTPVGKLVSAVTSDVETINELFTTVFSSLLRDVALIVGASVTLLLLDTKLALITLATVPPAFILITVFRIVSRKVFREVQMRISRVNTYLSEHLNGIQVVQLFGAEAKTARQFQEENQNLFKAYMNQMYVHATFRPLVDLLASISLAVVVYTGALYLGKETVSLGILIAFINLLGKFFDPIKDLAEKFSIMQSAMAGGERIFTLMDSPIEENKGQNAPRRIQGEISFSNVHFAYKKDDPVLKGISFTAKEGETLALVGYTGAGKTTITNLVTRLWPIQEGTIEVDRIDSSQYPLENLREAILPVLQDVVLFSGTLRDNLTLGKDFSQEELEKAVKTVHADFLLDLPQGLDTPLNEGGSNLSAGQRQLLSFARAIVHDPRILILDEATSNVDTDTEHLIQKALPALLEGRTSIVIAHRLSTIQHADRILVLDQGKVIEEGTHQELLAQKGTYFNLYELQFDQEVL